MEKATKEKGITLIALIITIIVMLILAGVTVSVALKGGLFKTTKEAAENTQIEIDRETLQSAVWGAIEEDGFIDFDKLDSNLPNGFTGSDGKYRSNKGNAFIVSQEDGIVKYREPSTGDLALIEKYFLGEDGEEKDLFNLMDPVALEEGNIIFKDDTSTISDASTSLQYIDDEYYFTGEDYAFVFAKYNGKIYKIVFKEIYDKETDTGEYPVKDVELAYEQKGREGQTVRYSYDGTEENMKDWTILYDNGEYIEIVSPEAMGNLTLGAADEKTIGNTDIDKAIYSYNNAITRLNDYCTSLVTNPDKISVRSVGSNPNNPSSENARLYTSDNLKILAAEYNGVLKGGDKNFEYDYIRMRYLKCLAGGKLYWFASRTVEENIGEWSEFGIGSHADYEENGYRTADTMSILVSANSNNGFGIYKKAQTNAVRPIVKLPADYGI